MTDESAITIGEHEWERGLWGMVLVSGALHVVGIGVLLLIPHSFAHHPPAVVSYTVDLVAPDRVGGNNLLAGGKGRVEAAPMVAAPKVEPPKPPPPKVEEPKPPEPKPEPQKVEPEKPAPAEVAPQPEAKPAEPPKVEEKPKEVPQPHEDEVALAEKKAEPPPAPTAVQAAPSPQAKPAPSPKLVAKAEVAKPQPAAPPKMAPGKAKEAAEARDERIAAAVKRIEQQTGKRGGGTGKDKEEPPGGPISVGPGEGAGGAVRGVEYLIYRHQMEARIKQNWAWAGANRSLEAVFHFSITDTGEVVDVRIRKSSGDPTYDTSVERAIRALNPLPPPPSAYRKEFSDVEYTFTPESLQM